MNARVVAFGLALGAFGCSRGARVASPAVVVVSPVSGEGVVAGTGEWSEASGAWRVKDEVEVEWHGSWWPATLLEKRGRDRWLVHYEGYGDDWDEVVVADRIRERRAEMKDEGDEAEDEPDP